MRIAAIVLGIVGGAIGFLGGLFNIFLGGVGSAIMEDNSGATLAALGTVAILISLSCIIASCFMNKRPKSISIFNIIAGVACIICGNYFSGIVILLSGIFGLLSNNKSLVKNAA